MPRKLLSEWQKNIGWHSDNEEKGSTSCIASLSLGTERVFSFRNSGSNEDLFSFNMILKSGSLLVMGKGCQENYNYCLPKDKRIEEPRLNLTFRLFDPTQYQDH